MKPKPPSAFIMLAFVVGLGLIGCKPEAREEEKKEPTEVAVQVARVTRATLRARVEAYGTVEAEPATAAKPAASARVASPSAGIVVEANAVEGRQVTKGEVLFRLNSRVAEASLEKAKLALEKARPGLKLAEQNLDRQQRLARIEGTSQKILQEAESQVASAKGELAAAQADLAAAETQRALLTVEAPFAGTLVRVSTKPGEAVDLNTVLVELVDLSRLVVTATVPAAEAALLKAGQATEIFIGSNDQAAAAGSVSFVSPLVDAKTGAASVRVTVPADAGLRPGQFARVRIVSDELAGRLAVPRSSVVTDVDGHSVIAVVEGDKASQKSVKTGTRDGDLVEVEGEGLKEGDMVVTVGAYGLPKETKVRVLKP